MSRVSKERWGLVALVLLLTVPLALILSHALGGFVRDLVVVPFLYLTWVGRLYLRAIPQMFFWGALLLFGLILVVANVLFARRDSEEGDGDGRGSQRVHRPDAGPVRQLTAQIQVASRSRYFRAALAQRLATLTLQVLDDSEDLSPGDTQRRLDGLGLPPEVRAFLAQGERPIWQHQGRGLLAWLRRRWRRDTEKEGRCGGVEQTVQYLENRLEDL